MPYLFFIFIFIFISFSVGVVFSVFIFVIIPSCSAFLPWRMELAAKPVARCSTKCDFARRSTFYRKRVANNLCICFVRAAQQNIVHLNMLRRLKMWFRQQRNIFPLLPFFLARTRSLFTFSSSVFFVCVLALLLLLLHLPSTPNVSNCDVRFRCPCASHRHTHVHAAAASSKCIFTIFPFIYTHYAKLFTCSA